MAIDLNDPVDGSVQVTLFPDFVAPEVPREDPLVTQVFLLGCPLPGVLMARNGVVGPSILAQEEGVEQLGAVPRLGTVSAPP